MWFSLKHLSVPILNQSCNIGFYKISLEDKLPILIILIKHLLDVQSTWIWNHHREIITAGNKFSGSLKFQSRGLVCDCENFAYLRFQHLKSFTIGTFSHSQYLGYHTVSISCVNNYSCELWRLRSLIKSEINSCLVITQVFLQRAFN